VKATLEELAELVATAPFLRPFGFVLESCAPYAAALERPGGVVSGITIMGAADVAMWLAILTQRGTAEQWVTTDLKTAFLRGARETDIHCTARLLKLGKRTAYGTAECRAGNGELLAHHVISYALVP
jgi:acyl-coenzyme A thioesterase PaaI-like protein